MNTCSTLRHKARIVGSLVVSLASVAAYAVTPPTPEQLERYRQDGTLGERMEEARRFGSYRADPRLAWNLQQRLKRAYARAVGLPDSEFLRQPNRQVPPAEQGGLPTIGSPRTFVLLVDFPDAAHAPDQTEAEARDRFFGNGDPIAYPYESVHSFYERSSYKQLAIQGHVFPWYTASHNRAYYEILGRDEGREALIMEALAWLDAEGHDFTQYDNDGDGTIDAFYVKWTGPIEWGSFWADWQPSWALNPAYSVDGKQLGEYVWSGIDHVNQTTDNRFNIHETGHLLGLPDYWDYDGSVGPRGGVGGLDMMDRNWGDHNCFSKLLLGWISPRIINSGEQVVDLLPSGSDGDSVLIMRELPPGTSFGEYFMVQYRKRSTGNDPSSYPGDGLLIWHVDSRLDPSGFDFLYNNSDTEHKLLRLMEADSLEEIEQMFGANAGDYYLPGHEFSGDTTPSSDNYLHQTTGIVIDSIGTPGGSMTARYRILPGHPPMALDLMISTPADTPVTIALSASDDGLPNPPGVLSYILTALPDHGTLQDPEVATINSVPYVLVNQGYEVRYVPEGGYSGRGIFRYKANDGGLPLLGGDSNDAVVTLEVGAQVGATGRVVAWGDNRKGQCNVPAANAGFLVTAGGFFHSLGLKADGSIVAWGNGASGQTGLPTPNTDFIGIATGAYHSLALKADGSVVAWGYNYYGQLDVPAPNIGFVAVASGAWHSLGLKADGSIVAWGWNEFGQTIVPGSNTGFVAIAAGWNYSIGLKADGSIVAWGYDDDGATNPPAPDNGYIAIAGGSKHGLALKADGSIVAWGSNNVGQCSVPMPNADFVGVAAGIAHSLGLRADGSIETWGTNYYGQLDVPSPNAGFVGVAGGGYHSLGLRADGSIVAWGDNSLGQCNVPPSNTEFVSIAGGYVGSMGLRADSSIVAWGFDNVVPSPNTGFVEVATGSYFRLGLRSDGSVVAWGYDNYGRLDVPAPNTGFVAVTAGDGHSLGLKADGSIVAWGCGYPDSNYGQCNVPTPNKAFTAIAAGGLHSLGMKADGSILAWGWNGCGQTDVPAPNAGFAAVAAGHLHSLGLKTDGSVAAWGCGEPLGNYGQCDVPEPNSSFVAVAAGDYHSLGLRSDGSIVAWGSNLYGQTIVPVPNSGFVAIAAGGAHSLGLKGRRADFDSTGGIDLGDFRMLVDFLGGPQHLGSPGLRRASLDGDMDVDLADFAAFQRAFDGGAR